MAVELRQQVEASLENERQRVEAVRRQQASLSQLEARAMEVDIAEGGDRVDSAEEAEAEKSTKGKGKEKKERNGWEIVGGRGRCAACLKEGTACVINLSQIEQWRKKVQEGKKFMKAPADTSCQQCVEVRRKVCMLPATEECQKAIEKGKKSTAAPSVGSGGK